MVQKDRQWLHDNKEFSSLLQMKRSRGFDDFCNVTYVLYTKRFTNIKVTLNGLNKMTGILKQHTRVLFYCTNLKLTTSICSDFFLCIGWKQYSTDTNDVQQ